jgi:5-formyltetrahydrofolate cyclo-ligase
MYPTNGRRGGADFEPPGFDQMTKAPAEDKAALRKAAKARRAGLAAAMPGAEGALGRHLLDILPQLGSGIVAGYWPIGDEIDLRPALNALADAGRDLALPAVVAGESVLRFHRWRPGDRLAAGAFGIGEPLPDADELRPGIVLVPLLAFDAVGHRLGYGGGYYDRTLAGLRKDGHITALGIGYAGQEIEALPAEPGDQAMDWIVTEAGVRKPKPVTTD